MLTTSLEGKNAIVCGSTQGIGRAIAVEFARLGAAVTLMARNAEGLARVLAELPRGHTQAHRTVEADFADWKQVQQKATDHVAAHGPVHILVNNTGGPPAGPAFEATPDDYLKAMTQHIACNQALVQAVAPGMRDAEYGRIINIISTSVVMPIKGLGVSNTVRAAVANWARTLAAEVAPLGITVNNVLPGFTRTARLESLIKGRASRAGLTPEEVERDMIASVPAKRFGSPEEIAAVAAFLASPAAAYVNGVNLPVDGGRLAAQ
jgi:3-oxoacyl-[acyl-carrier protein] reductase